MRNVVHVYAAGRDISRYQHSDFFALEIAQGLLPAVLALVAVNRGALDARLLQDARNLVGTMLGSAEHEHLLHLGVRKQEFLQKRSLAALVNTVEFLADALDGRTLGSHFHAHRVRA